MFGFFLFAVLFVALCLFAAEPTPQVEAAPVPVPDVDLPSLEELMAEVEAVTSRPVSAVAAAVAAPMAVAVVKVETPAFAEMTSAELRKECSRRAIAWRGVREGGKHLTKAQMVKALA